MAGAFMVLIIGIPLLIVFVSLSMLVEQSVKEVHSDYINSGLTSTHDQVRIIQDMKENNVDLHGVTNLGALFHHVDNVRLLYQEQDKDIPDWYSEKYKSKLKSQ